MTPPPTLAEVERQLAAAVDRHREAVASTRESGRSEASRSVAAKSVGRAVQLVSSALKRAADAGVPFERLVGLTGWEPDLVREGLERPVPAPRVVARLAPEGVDAGAVAEAAAVFEAIRRIELLTQRILGDIAVEIDVDAHLPVTAADLDELHDGLDAAWSAWRQRVG